MKRERRKPHRTYPTDWDAWNFCMRTAEGDIPLAVKSCSIRRLRGREKGNALFTFRFQKFGIVKECKPLGIGVTSPVGNFKAVEFDEGQEKLQVGEVPVVKLRLTTYGLWELVDSENVVLLHFMGSISKEEMERSLRGEKVGKERKGDSDANG